MAIGKVYCAILAGGSGTRMNTPVPKQFLMLGDAPVFVHSVRTLLAESRIEQLWIGSNGDWLELAKEQVRDYLNNDPRIHICEGGSDRESTMLNTLNAIKQNNTVTNDDVVLIHDAVRPFVTLRIIGDVIAALDCFDACNTVVPVNDTITKSLDGATVDDIPLRSELFAGQSPQGFKINRLLEAFSKVDSGTKAVLTDTTKVCFLQGIPVHLIKGEFFNFKITTQFDLQLAQGVLNYIEDARC